VIATIPADGLPEGTHLTIRWIGPDGSTLAEEPRTVPAVGEDHLTFELTSDLAAGDYRAEVWIKDRRIARQPFEVKR
jgi:uncharacterized protein YfaS (alpha-2-macroglobulin family)